MTLRWLLNRNKSVPTSKAHPVPVQFGDGDALTTFGRVPVANPDTLFDSFSRYQNSPLIWSLKEVGTTTITHKPNESAVDLTIGADSGDRIVRQSRNYFPYQPGKGQRIVMTGVFGSGQTGTIKRLGYFDDDNGVFFEQNGETYSVVLRSSTSGSPVDTKLAQSSWSKDKLNGTGPSGKTIELDKAQVFSIDLQWLGVGRVRYTFYVEGFPVVAHEVMNFNTLTTTYMGTATLPVRYEIVNTEATSSSSTFKTICAAVVSEGGFETGFGIPFGVSNGITTIGVTTRRSILNIRPKMTFNGITNRGLITLQEAGVFAQTNACFFEVVYGGTLGGTPNFQSANDESLIEYDVAATTVTGGISFSPGHVAAGGVGSNAVSNTAQRSFAARLPIALDIDGNHPTTPFTDVLSLVVTSMSGTTDVSGHFSWHEIK